jgi:putative transcriptional regulator
MRLLPSRKMIKVGHSYMNEKTIHATHLNHLEDLSVVERHPDMTSRLDINSISSVILRTARGWTQEQLAKAVVSRQSINSIEGDRYVPSLLLALTFARVFGCATEEIFTLEGQK